jgi:hypothetical protein
MPSRLLLLSILLGAASGCASIQTALNDAAPETPKPPRALTPEAAYNAGVLDMVRGDSDAARREWDRCLAMAEPGSDSRVDCMVALERMGNPAAQEP